MTSEICFAVQINEQNFIQVHYSSGVNRYYDVTKPFPKTVKNYMDKASAWMYSDDFYNWHWHAVYWFSSDDAVPERSSSYQKWKK